MFMENEQAHVKNYRDVTNSKCEKNREADNSEQKHIPTEWFSSRQKDLYLKQISVKTSCW